MVDVDRLHEMVAYVYLTADKGLFVNPQYPLHIGGKQRYADFLVLCPTGKKIWIVEVTRSKTGREIMAKCAQYKDALPEIRQSLGSLMPPDWNLGAWLFLRDSTMKAVQELKPSLDGIDLRFESIERAVSVWEWLRVDGNSRADVLIGG